MSNLKFVCTDCGAMQLRELKDFISKTQQCEYCANEKLILIDEVVI